MAPCGLPTAAGILREGVTPQRLAFGGTGPPVEDEPEEASVAVCNCDDCIVEWQDLVGVDALELLVPAVGY